MSGRGVQWLAIALSVIILAGLGVMAVRHSRESRQRDEAISEMLDQARTVEQELNRLQRELEARTREAEKNTRTATFMVGYEIARKSDVEIAARQAQQFGFRPVFVLDPTLSSFRELLDAVSAQHCEIVLSASPCTPESIAAKEARTMLAAMEGSAVDSKLYLLRNADDNDSNLSLIASAGYEGCIRHVDSGENTVLENGIITLSYSQIKSGEFDVDKRLNDAVENGQVILFVFEMGAIEDGALKETDIENALSKIQATINENDSRFYTLAESEKIVKEWVEQQILSRSELERFTAEQQKKIDALEDKLNEIYAQWNQEETP